MYWRIWFDALCSIKKNNPQDYRWMSIIFMSMGNALNILGLLILSNVFWGTPILLFQKIQFIEVKPIDSLLKFFIQFLIVPVVLNVYCLRRLERQEQRFLTVENPYKGKLFVSYILLSITGLLVAIFMVYLFK